MIGRIRSMVLDILYYAKERELKWEQIDVLSFVKDIALTFGPKIQSQNINFICDFDETVGMFEVDPGIIRSALINFLENALEACLEDTSKPAHQVSFGVRHDSTHIIFDVTDNGTGMDDVTRKNIFSLFFSSKGDKGTGLGLFISNQIIGQHGGRIEVESILGEGTRMGVKVPKMQTDCRKPSTGCLPLPRSSVH
jgi:signal transduction histidine kinase